MTFALTRYWLQITVAMLLQSIHRKKASHFIAKLLCGATLGLLLVLIADTWAGQRTITFFAAFYLIMLYCYFWFYSMYQVTPYIHSYYFVAALVLQDGTYNLFLIFHYLLGLKDATWQSWTLYVLVFAAVYGFTERFLFHGLWDEGEDQLYLTSFIAALLVFITNQATGSFIILNQHYDWGNMEVRFYNVLVSALALSVQFGVFRQNKLEQERQQIEQLLHEERKQHQLSKDTIEQINLKCHDLKHQLATIRRRNDLQQIEEELRQTEETVMIYDSRVHTGNDALDIILMEKGLICEKNKVKLVSLADGSCLSFLDDSDLYSMFGNFLDNAIECVMQETDLEKRFIMLTLHRKDELAIIHVENYCGSELTFRDSLPETTKEDKRYHGFGMKSIRFLAEKYGGTAAAHQEGALFILNIMLPIPKEI